MHEYLSRYRALSHEISQLKKEIERLDLLIKAPRISHLTGMPRSGRVSDGMDIAAKVADMRDEYYLKLSELLEMQSRIEGLINSLEGEERIVIRYKYIDGLNNFDISEQMNYSERTIKRRLQSALRRLKGNDR